MHKKNEKIQPVAENTVDEKPVRKPYVIAIIPANSKYKKKSIGNTKGIIFKRSIKNETVIYDYKKGVILPENINVEEIMSQCKITLIVPDDKTIKSRTKGSKTVIIANKRTPIFFLRITTDYWTNPKIPAALVLTQNINYNSDNSGNDGKELELSA